MRDAPDGHQPQRQAGPPWDPWTRAPAPERPSRLEFQPRAQPPPSPESQPSGSSGPLAAHQRTARHEAPQAPRRERSRWYLLLPAAIVIPLLTPLYNRSSPELWGLPFFYWCQMVFVVMGASVTAIVQLATRRRRP